jgi:hypothetical protein
VAHLFERSARRGSAWYRDRQSGLFGRVEAILEPLITEKGARSSAARALFSAVHGIVSISLDQKLGDFDRTESDRQVRFVVKSIADGLTALASAPRPDIDPH